MTDHLPAPASDELALVDPGQLEINPAAVYLAGLSKGSRPGMRQALDRIAGMLINSERADCLRLPWAALRFQHTAAIRSNLLDHYKPATANKHLSALRGVLRSAWRLGLMQAEDYQRAVDLPVIQGSSLPAGRELTAGELQALMAECEKDPGPAGVRDAAILGLMVTAGLRREEMVSLDLADFNPKTSQLKITGKRAKERTAYPTNGAADALADWLTLRGSTAGPLFLPIDKGGKIHYVAGKMTPQAIYSILDRRGRSAGVARFSPHDLRRTFVSNLLDAGVDIATVAKMAGHSNIQTTARYDRRPEQAKQKASQLLYIPYHRRSTKGA